MAGKRISKARGRIGANGRRDTFFLASRLLDPMTETAFVCPICDHECETRNHLREHLHDRHHKSEIIDRYLAVLKD
jgi:hypothetical protein